MVPRSSATEGSGSITESAGLSGRNGAPVASGGDVQVHADADQVRVTTDQGAVDAVELAPAADHVVLLGDGRQRVAAADDVDRPGRVPVVVPGARSGRRRALVCRSRRPRLARVAAAAGAAVARANRPRPPALRVQDLLGDRDLLRLAGEVGARGVGTAAVAGPRRLAELQAAVV